MPSHSGSTVMVHFVTLTATLQTFSLQMSARIRGGPLDSRSVALGPWLQPPMRTPITATDDSVLLFIGMLPVLVGEATAQGFYADFEAGQG